MFLCSCAIAGSSARPRARSPCGILIGVDGFAPFSLAEEHQSDVEARAGVVLVDLEHAAEFLQRLFVHARAIEGDAEIAMLLALALRDGGEIDAAVPSDAMDEPRREQSVERLADLELHEARRLDEMRHVAASVHVL